MDLINKLSNDKKNRLIKEFLENSDEKAGMIGGYCEEGFPLFFVNDQMLSLLGFNSTEEFNEAIDGKVANTIHPDDMANVIRDLGSSFYEGQTYKTVYRMPRKDGSWFWTVDRGRVIRADDGRLAIISMCSDMTDFVERQNELEKQRLLNESTLENMPGGYHRCANAEGYPFLYVSDKFLEIFGWTREELKTEFDNKFINMLHPDDRNLTNDYVERIKQKANIKRDAHEIYRMRAKSGYLWVTDATTMVTVGDNIFYQGSITDISSYIEQQEKDKKLLQDALNKAEIANKSKTNFLFNISHEIRTPLNAVLGFNEIARKNITDPVALNALEKSALAGKQLLGVINDILDMSRIQSGKILLNDETIDVKEHISTLALMFSSMAEKRGIGFELIDETRTPFLQGDGQRIGQIITNLLGNAIKFTQKGGKITYQVAERPCKKAGFVTIEIKVSDTGIGMSDDFQTHMYSIFERERNPLTAKIQGTGLGLSISKSLADKMGAKLECKSKLGCGTTFTLTMDLAIANVEVVSSANETEEQSLEGLKVLLVEDNELNREIAEAILSDLGCSIDCAVNGLEAVHKVMDSKIGDYDVVLMDVQMPIMDGYRATKEIRFLRDKELAKIPIIAMTANAFEEDRKKALEVGMDEHIAKPISVSSLCNTILKVLKR